MKNPICVQLKARPSLSFGTRLQIYMTGTWIHKDPIYLLNYLGRSERAHVLYFRH